LRYPGEDVSPIAFLVAFAAASASATAPACPDELFRIERSKNANVIVYELRRGSDGEIDRAQPVRASWIMLASHGEREDLNLLERTLAYGFEVEDAAPRPGWTLRLKAEKKRPIAVREVAGCVHAMATIGGSEGALTRIYVKADDRTLIPTIAWVDVFGVDPTTGATRYERIVPDKPPEEQPSWTGP
jgi:hypothetical protein